MAQLKDYVKRLSGKWQTSVGAVSFLLFVISKILGYEEFLPDWAWFLVLIISWFWAGYSVFAEVAPKPVDLFLKVTTPYIQTRVWHHFLPRDSSVHARVACFNRGSSRVKLNQLTVAAIDLSSPIFTLKGHRFEHVSVGSSGGVRWPEHMDGGYDKEYEIHIDFELKDTDLKDCAQGLRKLTTFGLELKLEYQDMDGNSYTQQERIEGSYSEFLQRVRDRWSSNGRQDLLDILDGKASSTSFR